MKHQVFLDSGIVFLFKFRVVGDNWDIEVKSRSQTITKTNKSLHYFHMYAVADRVYYPENVSRSKPQRSIKSLSMDEFLPTSVVQEAFVEDLSNIIPRILVNYLKSYTPLWKSVTKHIVHPHNEEMKKQSEWVMLINLIKAQYW
jgi:hypothetical protein